MEKQSQNPMAVEPIPRLMARIGAPIVLSMILQAAYNVVDSAYLARMADGGEAALTALELSVPGATVHGGGIHRYGVGHKRPAGPAVGAGRPRTGQPHRWQRAVYRAVHHGRVHAVCGGGRTALCIFPERRRQHRADILESAIAYLHICCGVPVGIVMFSVYEKVLQATGDRCTPPSPKSPAQSSISW